MMRGGSNAAAISGLGFILLVALALRLWGLGKESLWLDEIIAATHAMQPLWRLPGEVIRWDMHPPVYFAQLSIWGWFGDGDYALLLNSVFWGVATVAVVGFAGWRLFGPAAGLIGALITAVAPGAVAASQTLRMYPFMSCVIVLVAYLYTTRIEVAERLGWRQLWLPGLLQLLLIYTHAVGFFHVFFLGLYALVLCLLVRGPRTDFARLLAVHIALGLASLPVIASSLLRSSASVVIEDAGQLLRAATGVLFTTVEHSGEIQQGVTLTLLALAAVLALLPGQRRRPIFWLLICAPLLINVAISLTFKPMFKTWLFAYIVPVLALSLGAGLAELARNHLSVALGRLTMWAICAVLAGVLLWSWRGYSEASLKPNDFRGAAEMLARRVAEGDAIFAPDDAATFWAMARYLVGPRWGSPLDIQSTDPNERWASVRARLPESVGRYFGVYGETNQIMYGKVPIIVGYGRDDGAAAARYDRIWVVTYERSRGRHEVPGFPPPTHHSVETIRFKGVVVERFERNG